MHQEFEFLLYVPIFRPLLCKDEDVRDMRPITWVRADDINTYQR